MHRAIISRLSSSSSSSSSSSACTSSASSCSSFTLSTTIRLRVRSLCSLSRLHPRSAFSLDLTPRRSYPRSFLSSPTRHSTQTGYSTSAAVATAAVQPVKSPHHATLMTNGTSSCTSSPSIPSSEIHIPHALHSVSTPFSSQPLTSATSPAPSITATTLGAPPTIPKRLRSPSHPRSSNKKIFHVWTPEQDALILMLHQEHKIGWRTIGQLLDLPHTTCYTRFVVTIKSALDNGWTPPPIQDVQRLNELLEKARWLAKEKLVAAKIARSTATATAATKATVTTKTSKRAVWDAAADQLIKDMVQEAHSWPAIGAALQRPYASCYSRYYSALDPVLQEPWSADTVACVEAWVRQGVCWRKIAKDLGIRPVTCKAKWVALRRSEVAVPSSTSAAALSDGGDRSDSSENMDLATVSHQRTESGTETTTTTTQPAVSKNSNTKWIAFSKEESTAIFNLVSKHGSENWSLILSDFQARFLLQCSTTKSRSQRRMRQRLLDITAQDLSHQYSRIVRTKYHWTFDEETMLIQQVLRHGAETDQWGLIASQLTGIHTAEECRTRWKQLDIPVAQNLSKWSRIEESTFWILWQEFGSDFDRISKLSGGERSPEECQRYFKAKTVGFPDPDKDKSTFRNRVEKLQATLPVARQKYMFTKERSLRLQKAMQLFKRHTTNARTSSPVPSSSWGSWSWVANIVQRGLSATACMDHWYYLRRDMDPIYGPVEKGQTFVTPTTPNSWSHEELKLLDQGVRELGHVWSEIQDRFLPWRSTRSIRQRWLLISNKSVRVTEDEYYTIISAGEKTEQIDYDVLASKLPGWNRSPCRRVFETSYKHILATTVWLPEDDQLLVEKVLETKGRDWNVIAKHFKGVQTARAPLYEEISKRTDLIRVGDVDIPMRTHKTAWQCRLRWCQLVDPLMPKEWIWSFGGASRILRLSKQLLNDTSTST